MENTNLPDAQSQQEDEDDSKNASEYTTQAPLPTLAVGLLKVSLGVKACIYLIPTVLTLTNPHSCLFTTFMILLLALKILTL